MARLATSAGGARVPKAGTTPVWNREQLDELRRKQLSSAVHWRFYINLALMLLDAAMVIVASQTVLLLMGQWAGVASLRLGLVIPAVVYLLVMGVVSVICLHAVGVYHRHVMGDGYQLNVLLFKGMLSSWVVMCAISFVFGFTLGLGTLTVMTLASWIVVMGGRAVSRMLITRERHKGAYAYGTVIVGSPEGIGNALRFLANRSQLNYRPSAVCPVRFNPATELIEADPDAAVVAKEVRDNWGSPLPVLDYDDSRMAEHVVELGAQTVLVTDVIKRYSDNFNIFSVRMESLNLEVAMLTSTADVGSHELSIRSIQGVSIITQRLAQYSPYSLALKRAFDLIVSSLAIVCSLIVTLPVAIAIKLTDHGPVFYTQTRIGLRGKPFKMIKFRSMVVNADALKAELAHETGQDDRFIFKMKDDPRITPVGRFIRRFSIDELPQFLNVFKGDMSVVGPRPPLPEEYARYNKLYATRMLVKPGITGPWQVSGRSDLSEEESEALDVGYVQSWSILGDIVLLLRTVGAVLSHKGAY
ncbi:sugar transferase [Bifidobacterium pullorum subsp. saeculare]|uniref:Sugar transferase n=1 Tax=Bifidobacterium pullorum subsp. saeculare TaxID=78257 RepID=A0A938WZU2_9BIFI|nr:sugar transferase [Bifidobacterium pullorum]MBM6699657.1 sugar transferase [Bifidobacterium pullorum subsp. saeculare]